MTILLFVLMQINLVTPTQPKGSAVWVDTPVGHWSCPSRFMVHKSKEGPIVVDKNDPLPCRPVVKVDGLLPSMERVYWTWRLRVPDNGRLRVTYPADFITTPGCEVIGTVRRFEGIGKSGMTILSTPGELLELDCNGILPRK